MNDENNLVSQLQNETTRRKAFEQIVKQYSPQMYAQIRRMVMSHDDADDVLQNAFVKAWMSIDSFRGDSRISTWLYRIAYNETLIFLAKGRSTLSIDMPVSNDDETENLTIASQLMADDYFNGDETAAQLEEAIASLPPKQRMVFNMKYFDDMKYEDISEQLGTSIGALKASYHHAVKKIEAFFENLIL